MSTDFATKLISLRGDKNLTQQQLADAVGITPSQISRYESGQAKPRKTILFKLATALGVSVADLNPAQHLQVVIGERDAVDPQFKLRKRMLDELALLDTEETRKIKKQAEEAGIPFEKYFTDMAEQNFIEMAKQAAESGDIGTASFYRIFAYILFGTNIKILESDQKPET